MEKHNRSEQGQALILIVLGIVALLGFAALAIDGGRIYTDRQDMQNASDTSSLAGAAEYANYFDANGILYSNWPATAADCELESWFISATVDAKNAAISRANNNGYVIDTTVDTSVPLPGGDYNGVKTWCGSDDYVGFKDNYIDIQTFITHDTPSSFAQFVFSGPLRQTTESIARIYPQTSLAFGHAVVALNDGACSGNQSGALFNGNNTILINGGGVFSNGCFSVGGTSGSINVTNGSNNYVGSYVASGSFSVSPAPAQSTQSLPPSVTAIPAPDCSGLTNQGAWNGGGALVEGQYDSINIGANDVATMSAGLYCVSGDVTIGSQGELYGNLVTIYLTGDFNVNGNATVQLDAPLAPASPEIPGVLIYNSQYDHSTSNQCVDLQGTSQSWYTGTIYAPDCQIDIGGSSGVQPTYSTQLIGWDVEFHGNVTLDINFQNNQAYQVPPRLNLQK